MKVKMIRINQPIFRFLYFWLIILLLITIDSGMVIAEDYSKFETTLMKEVLDEDPRISALAMFNLGQNYLSKDKVKAYMWYTISAARHKADAFYPITSRKKLIPRMTQDQIKLAEQMARKWMMNHWGNAPVSMAHADFKELKRRLTAGDTRALEEMIQRAETNDQTAQIELGEMYGSGYGIAVKSNTERAFYWWVKAADGGNVEMMNKLGVLYLNGHPGYNINPEPKKGEIWLLKAAKKGHAGAAYLLTRLYSKGKGDISSDIKKYRYWYGKWAEAKAKEGDFNITRRLAGLYSGRTIDPAINGTWTEDLTKAFNLYHKAANGGDINAQTEIGIIYLSGRGVKKNENFALQWFLKAADRDTPMVRAWAHLVIMYEQGIGTDKNPIQIQKWLGRIFRNKDYTTGSLHLIGQLYNKGDYLPQDYFRAAHYYKLSATRGKPEAQFHLGQLFWKGLGVTKSPIDAYAWWSISLDNFFSPDVFPYPLVKAALKNADKSMTLSQIKAAERKAEYLIKENENLGIIKGKEMKKILKR